MTRSAFSTIGREQHRRACGVGVDIEADRPGSAGLLNQRERVAAPPEVLAAGAFVVGDDDTGAGAAADLEGLLHRLLDAVVLVAHVGDVEAAGSACDLWRLAATSSVVAALLGP